MKSFKLFTTLSTLLILLSCGNREGDYDATGSFEATEIIVSSQANGMIIELNITEGDLLQKGQMVGYIDSTQLYLQKMSILSNAKGVIAQQPDINAQTAALKAQINTLKREKADVYKRQGNGYGTWPLPGKTCELVARWDKSQKNRHPSPG